MTDDSLARSLLRSLFALGTTTWVGGLWVVGGLVVPHLFSTLPERQLAGAVAASLFLKMYWLGYACAALSCLALLLRFSTGIWRRAAFWIVCAMLALTLTSHLAVHPRMESLRGELAHTIGTQPEARQRFGDLHRISSALYLAQCLLGLGLIRAGSGRQGCGRRR
ncbi:MAG: hypothetical protein AMXMBFR6_19360 [Betaproteobacteria bacterium]|nr:DUF4149 domain-containing protein [Rhodocyclaceae bacterium]MCG3187715.1 hypothetical protein [Rhodocyclaceae bacterium]